MAWIKVQGSQLGFEFNSLLSWCQCASTDPTSIQFFDLLCVNRYHELDIQKTLRDSLSYKTLIEYPVLHVVLREQWEEYPLKGAGKRKIQAIEL